MIIAAGLETSYADYSHVGAAVKVESDEWVLVDPTPFYYPNFNIKEAFKRRTISDLCKDFQKWQGYLLEDAQYIGLPLGYLIEGGSCYERIVGRENNLIQMVFSAFLVEW